MLQSEFCLLTAVFPIVLQAGIPGFYDPVTGVPKTLRVRYKFRGRMHYAEIPDYMPVVLPLKGACSDWHLHSPRGGRGSPCTAVPHSVYENCGSLQSHCGSSLFLETDMLLSAVDHLVE